MKRMDYVEMGTCNAFFLQQNNEILQQSFYDDRTQDRWYRMEILKMEHFPECCYSLRLRSCQQFVKFIPSKNRPFSKITLKMESLPEIHNEQSNNLTFKDGFQSNYQYARAVGLWPFQIVHNVDDSNEKTHVRLVDILWFIVSIALYLTAAFYNFHDIKNAHDSIAKSYTLFIYYIFQITALVFGAFGIVLDLFNRNRLVNILEKFSAFDDEVGLMFVWNDPFIESLFNFFTDQVSKFGFYFDYKHECRRNWVYLAIPNLFVSILLIISNFLYNENWHESFDFLQWYCPFLLRSVVWISIVISFKTFIRNLYERFAALNSLLR